MAKQIPWAAITALLLGVLGAIAWLFRRAWVRVRRELKMLREVYAFAFGAEEVGWSLDDESVEERLERGTLRFEWLQESMEHIEETQREIVRTQEEIVERRDLDIETPEVRGTPDWDPSDYRNGDND